MSKSSILSYENCPLSFYYSKIEKREGLPNVYFERGLEIHSAIKNYYESGTIYQGDHVDYFDNFLRFHTKVGKPKAFEQMYTHEEWKLRGIIDAFFEDGNTLIDFKTSDYKPKEVADYRFELGIYAFLLRKNGFKVDRYGIVFLKSGHVWYEQAADITDEIWYRKEKVLKGIERKDFAPKENKWCFSCSYRDICPKAQQKKEDAKAFL